MYISQTQPRYVVCLTTYFAICWTEPYAVYNEISSFLKLQFQVETPFQMLDVMRSSQSSEPSFCCAYVRVVSITWSNWVSIKHLVYRTRTWSAIIFVLVDQGPYLYRQCQLSNGRIPQIPQYIMLSWARALNVKRNSVRRARQPWGIFCSGLPCDIYHFPNHTMYIFLLSSPKLNSTDETVHPLHVSCRTVQCIYLKTPTNREHVQSGYNMQWV